MPTQIAMNGTVPVGPVPWQAAITSARRRQRDAGNESLMMEMRNAMAQGDEKLIAVEEEILKLIDASYAQGTDAEHWQQIHGGCVAVATAADIAGTKLSDRFVDATIESLRLCITHAEARVRLAAGIAFGRLARAFGLKRIYTQAVEYTIIENIEDTIDSQVEPSGDYEQLREKLAKQYDMKPDHMVTGETTSMQSTSTIGSKAEVFHDTAGWASLETSVKTVHEFLKAQPDEFLPFFSDRLKVILLKSLSHRNRFVRETGYYFIANLSQANGFPHEQRYAECISDGLADNWSQVRLASATAAHNFLSSIAAEEDRRVFYPLLLPRLCINRYYVAEGVRIYSQNIWRELFDNRGQSLVEEYISDVVTFYIAQTQADNHAVREAACACIAELGIKIKKDVIAPHVMTLLEALIVCLKDESWPVRDASLTAIGRFASAFPTESKERFEMEILPLMLEHVGDNINSVREDASIALVMVVEAMNNDNLFTKVKTWFTEHILKAEEQKPESKKNANLEATTTFGVAKPIGDLKHAHDNDDALHTDQVMYSCGSLAPKLRRGGGCMDHAFKKPTEPWEWSDGCIYLYRELTRARPEDMADSLGLVAKLSKVTHFHHHVYMLETLWQLLPIVAENLGKTVFKRKVEDFFDGLKYSLACGTRVTEVAASECIERLSKFIGPNIMAGRVENYNPVLLDIFRPHMHKHVSAQGGGPFAAGRFPA
eukprot:Clim_evm31s88 gene=Clim_evmTU31s88